MRRLLSSVALLACLWSVNTVQAQTVVYDNGPPLSSGGSSELSGSLFQASDFSLGAAATISSFGFWADTDLHYGKIWWAFLANDNGPGNVIRSDSAAFDANSGVWDGKYGGYNSYYYEVPVGSLALESGAYWLVLGFRSDPFNSFGWTLATNNLTADDMEKNPAVAGYENWTSNRSDHAFILYSDAASTVPEPVSLVLLGTGLVGLGAMRRRKRR